MGYRAMAVPFKRRRPYECLDHDFDYGLLCVRSCGTGMSVEVSVAEVESGCLPFWLVEK